MLLSVLLLIAVTALACGTASATLVPDSNDSGERDSKSVIAQTEAGSNELPTSKPASVALAAVGNEVGLAAPDFTLPRSGGGAFTLSSFRGDRNIVLVFYRAFW